MTTRIDPMRIYHEASKQNGEQNKAYFEYKLWLSRNGLTNYQAQAYERHIKVISAMMNLHSFHPSFTQMIKRTKTGG